jgi:DNA-binding Lrp family transcriptional regulator
MFTTLEKAILAVVQDDLPLTPTPYADIAAQCDTDEQTVLALLQRLRSEGIIRRFGATLRHQRVGFVCNIMVAWAIPKNMNSSARDAAGQILAAHPQVSHCFWRPSTAADWPYALYSMLHGRNDEECLSIVQSLSVRAGLTDYVCLSSLAEFKKTSMRYF